MAPVGGPRRPAATELPPLPLRSWAGWLLAVGEPDRLEQIRRRCVPDPDDRAARTWTDARGRTLLVVAHDGGTGPRAWSLAPDRATAVRGQLRWVGTPWSSPDTWPAAVARRAGGRSVRHPLEGTVGDGAAVTVDRRGRGVAAADPLGLRSLYRGAGAGVDVVATTPGLVADALGAVGRRPRRDPMLGAWLGLVRHPFGGASSYEGVERLATGATAVVGRGRLEVRRGAPWRDPADLDGLGPSDLVDAVEEAVLENIEAASELGRAPVLDLTGGKDSRVVLAVALGRLGLDRFTVRTVGGPRMPDVATASHIATRLGFAHESGIPVRPPEQSLAERMDDYIDRTDGMQSVWTLARTHDGDPEVRLSGTSGESLRASRIEEAFARSGRPETLAEVTDFLVASHHRGSACLLRPEVRAALDDGIAAHLRQLLDDGVPSSDLLCGVHLGHHGIRFVDSRADYDRDHRVMPLVDLRAARAVHALGTGPRRADDVPFALVERASPILAAVPFATGAWNGDHPLVELEPLPRRPAADPAPPPARAERWSTVGVAQARPDDERRAFVEECFADDDSEIWEVADRTRVRAAVEGFDDLEMKPRQQLYGLATGARWLAG